MNADFTASNQFQRSLREQSGRTLIESHCKQCGEILVGSVIYDDIDLLGQERRHAARCLLVKPPPISGQGEV